MDENKELGLSLTNEELTVFENSQLKLNLKPTIVFENCEWCFQFDEDEPKVFAAAGKPEEPTDPPKITFTLSNTSNSNIVFSHNGREFKLFARELSEEGEKLIKNNYYDTEN